MSAGVSEQLGRTLEDAFFARQDQDLLDRLRRTEREGSRRHALAAASGVTDDAILDRLLALGIGPETFSALSLVPLVLVAWADGSLDAREAAALQDAAQGAGIARGSEAGALLAAWLGTPPPPRLEQAWHAYVRSLAPTLPQAARDALHHQVIGRARQVAEASGGFLGLGPRISAAEARLLASLEAAFAA